MAGLVGTHMFEAVSYVWGNSVLAEKVLCDYSSSHLRVTTSLLEVLRRLATLPSGPAGRASYWIDGVCINQEDLEERSDQVQKMANIYRRAARVHVFLGAFDSRHSGILESKWFTRRWVIQEAIAAQEVILHFKVDGEWRLLHGWDALRLQVDSLFLKAYNDPVIPPAANFLRDIAGTTRTSWSSIFALMLKFHTAQCMEDSDRLFALNSWCGEGC